MKKGERRDMGGRGVRTRERGERKWRDEEKQCVLVCVSEKDNMYKCFYVTL